MQAVTILVLSPSCQCSNVTDNKQCVFYLSRRFPKMVKFGYIDQLATYSSLFAHTDFISSDASHRSNVPYSSFPSLVSGYCFGCETSNSINGFLRKKHKEMAGCDWTQEFQACAVDKKTYVKQTKEWRPSEKCSDQPVLLRSIVFRFMSIKCMTFPQHSLVNSFENSHLAGQILSGCLTSFTRGSLLLFLQPLPHQPSFCCCCFLFCCVVFFMSWARCWSAYEECDMVANLLSILPFSSGEKKVCSRVDGLGCESARLSWSVLNSDSISRHGEGRTQ